MVMVSLSAAKAGAVTIVAAATITHRDLMVSSVFAPRFFLGYELTRRSRIRLSPDGSAVT
jgi:hypothetical protein